MIKEQFLLYYISENFMYDKKFSLNKLIFENNELKNLQEKC